MAKPKNKKGKRSKPSVKVGDITPSKDPKGGRKGSKLELAKAVATGKHLSKVEIHL